MQVSIEFTQNFIEADVTVEVAELADLTKRCFLFSMDLRLDKNLRGILRSMGGQFRLQLRDLINKVFDENTEELNNANQLIKSLNQELKDAKQSIDKVTDTIGGLGELASQLDELLKIVGIII